MMQGMNANDHGREARSRNLKRLHTLTVGTVFASILATGGFTALAAATYSGATTTQTAAVAQQGTTTIGGITFGTTTVRHSTSSGTVTTGGSRP